MLNKPQLYEISYLFSVPDRVSQAGSASVAMDGGAAANWRMDAALSGAVNDVAHDLEVALNNYEIFSFAIELIYSHISV